MIWYIYFEKISNTNIHHLRVQWDLLEERYLWLNQQENIWDQNFKVCFGNNVWALWTGKSLTCIDDSNGLNNEWYSKLTKYYLFPHLELVRCPGRYKNPASLVVTVADHISKYDVCFLPILPFKIDFFLRFVRKL